MPDPQAKGVGSVDARGAVVDEEIWRATDSLGNLRLNGYIEKRFRYPGKGTSIAGGAS